MEAPKEISQVVTEALMDCMVRAGRIFCSTVPLGADAAVGDHWIH